MISIYGNPIEDRDWWLRHVDGRCRACGQTSAGSSWCFECNSRDIEYRTHTETPEGETLWCQTRKPRARMAQERPAASKQPR